MHLYTLILLSAQHLYTLILLSAQQTASITWHYRTTDRACFLAEKSGQLSWYSQQTTGCKARGWIPGGAKENISSPKRPNWLWGPPNRPFSGHSYFVMDKAAGALSRTLSSSGEIKNEWRYACTPSHKFMACTETFSTFPSRWQRRYF